MSEGITHIHYYSEPKRLTFGLLREMLVDAAERARYEKDKSEAEIADIVMTLKLSDVAIG